MSLAKAPSDTAAVVPPSQTPVPGPVPKPGEPAVEVEHVKVPKGPPPEPPKLEPMKIPVPPAKTSTFESSSTVHPPKVSVTKAPPPRKV